jgi:transcriptional regulator with XRE-family HTH domain
LSTVEPIRSPAIDGRDVGRRIARARYEAGWMTQKTLAELLCVCVRSVQAYESGRTIPYRHLHRLAEIFEKPSSWFLDGEQRTEEGSSPVEHENQILEGLEAQTRVLKALALQIREMRSTLNALSSRFTELGDQPPS